MIKIVIGDKSFYADGYIPKSKEKSIQFYRNRSDLDYIPPVNIKGNMLSDFGKKMLGGKMNNKNCCLCKYYKDGYCENLELCPQYPSTCCDYFENKDNCEDCIAIPVSLVENLCEALSEYEHSDGDCFSEIHDACVDIDAFCRDKLNEPSSEYSLGKWIDRSIPGMAQFMCSRCEIRSFFKTSYCPNCGKKMEVEE